MYRPLADELRPKTLDEVVGQRHILGENGLLRRVIQGGTIPNMIFYGPSGTGKTTVAEIAAARVHRPFYRLNATTATLADIKAVMQDVGTLLAPDGVVLYLDEIQYFNKKQQQSLLEFMENGKLTLIAATTENPYFYVYNAVLSRSTVFEFKPVPAEEILPVVRRGIRRMGEDRQVEVTWEEGVEEQLAQGCGGDVRKALNAVEALFAAHALDLETVRLTREETALVAQRSAMRYDRDGDSHYDILSAFQKSIRGSDPDAAVHYLARLLEAGDLISPCRRLMVIASEDVGLAYPQAVSVVKACVDSANMLGLPEARIPLAQAAIFLATAPKSNGAILAIDSAMKDLRQGKGGEVPAFLRDSHYGGAEKLGHGQGYRYAHDYPRHYVPQQYLPDELKDRVYYHYGDNKTEQAAKRYWDEIKGKP
ncbi:replication-associated recombination protein A [Evtepia sp.]|uniref:replication-associated recombination protein A n=1 Tax=Evtepia sp. TaxID=2773933 RepID=UPI002A81AE1C|nr:replication-associated recombination protein A [Evtepia sp.]MDY3992735.1 replication-associated recombination protein A [Evtepia sp.]MDY4431290.1 replication-associated recombination protein A [Evtepia sp.]